MSVARFIADQRTNYRVPHTLTCALLGVSLAWFYKWLGRAGTPGPHTEQAKRRARLDAAVAAAFTAARGLHGSPRLHADLRDAGWVVSEKTVADSMRRQGLVARRIRRRNGLTRQDKTKAPFGDLLKRDFTAPAPNTRWVGDITEIPTAAGKLYLATVIDLYSRRLLGAATSRHPNAELACEAIKMAVAARGGQQTIHGVIFHTDPLNLPPTPPTTSPGCAAGSGSANPWDGSAHASTTPPPRRSSPASNGRSCPDTTSQTPAEPRPSCWTGATASTTMIADTARPT